MSSLKERKMQEHSANIQLLWSQSIRGESDLIEPVTDLYQDMFYLIGVLPSTIPDNYFLSGVAKDGSANGILRFQPRDVTLSRAEIALYLKEGDKIPTGSFVDEIKPIINSPYGSIRSTDIGSVIYVSQSMHGRQATKMINPVRPTPQITHPFFTQLSNLLRERRCLGNKHD